MNPGIANSQSPFIETPVRRRIPAWAWRIPSGLLLAFGSLGLSNLNHRCPLGYKWFEHHGPECIAVVILLLIVATRRAIVGLLLAIVLAVSFHIALVPAYLKWIHGPSSPWARNGSNANRILEDLKQIDAQIDALQARPQAISDGGRRSPESAQPR